MSHYENYYVRNLRLEGRHEDYYRYPERYYVKPFRIAGNIYYVGDKKVCSHLIDTGEGLILIDTGYPQADYMYLHAIWDAGFRPQDVRYILHTHAHLDHMGATVPLKAISGCETFMSEADALAMRDRPELVMMPPEYGRRLFRPDHLLCDGDVVRLGNTAIRCLLTPGHTQGVMSFFLDVEEGGRTYRAGTFGGAGFITLYQEYLLTHGLPVETQQVFLHTLDRLMEERVDIVLGNHPDPNHILEKRALQLEQPGTNPFLDPEDWGNYLGWVKAEFLQFLEDGN